MYYSVGSEVLLHGNSEVLVRIVRFSINVHDSLLIHCCSVCRLVSCIGAATSVIVLPSDCGKITIATGLTMFDDGFTWS